MRNMENQYGGRYPRSRRRRRSGLFRTVKAEGKRLASFALSTCMILNGIMGMNPAGTVFADEETTEVSISYMKDELETALKQVFQTGKSAKEKLTGIADGGSLYELSLEKASLSDASRLSVQVYAKLADVDGEDGELVNDLTGEETSEEHPVSGDDQFIFVVKNNGSSPVKALIAVGDVESAPHLIPGRLTHGGAGGTADGTEEISEPEKEESTEASETEQEDAEPTTSETEENQSTATEEVPQEAGKTDEGETLSGDAVENKETPAGKADEGEAAGENGTEDGAFGSDNTKAEDAGSGESTGKNVGVADEDFEQPDSSDVEKENSNTGESTDSKSDEPAGDTADASGNVNDQEDASDMPDNREGSEAEENSSDTDIPDGGSAEVVALSVSRHSVSLVAAGASEEEVSLTEGWKESNGLVAYVVKATDLGIGEEQGTTESGGPDLGKADPVGPQIGKTATALDAGNKTTVTLSVGATQEKTASDVVFVLDKSTSVDVREAAKAMLTELMERAGENKIKVGVVIFNRTAHTELELTELNQGNLERIKSAINKELESGTNLHAGLEAGKAMLDGDDTVADDAKHLIFISDGVTYMWGTDESPMTVYSEDKKTGEVEEIVAGNEMHLYKKHHMDVESYWKDLSDVKEWVRKYGNEFEKTEKTYAVTYEGGYITKENDESDYKIRYISSDDLKDYGNCNDLAQYNAALTWSEICQKYNAYAFGSTRYKEEYPFGITFMLGLNTLGGTAKEIPSEVKGMFDAVKSSILYAVESAMVTDVIGKDFDLDGMDSFSLTVGGQTLEKTMNPDNPNQIYFGSQKNGTYPYKVTYTNEDSEESLEWSINTPVEQVKGLTLSYGLKLNSAEKKTAPGDYTVPTNKKAEITYKPTAGEEGNKAFPVPEVTYTVSGPDLPDSKTKWEKSKSKTATNLDSNYESEVTLSLPAYDYEASVDVVMVIDVSSSMKEKDIAEAKKAAAALCDELAAKDKVDTKIGIVTFDKTAHNLTEGLVSAEGAKKAIENIGASADTNLMAGLMAGKKMLDAGTATDKYLVVMSDGIPIYWMENGKPVSKVLHKYKNLNENGTPDVMESSPAGSEPEGSAPDMEVMSMSDILAADWGADSDDWYLNSDTGKTFENGYKYTNIQKSAYMTARYMAEEIFGKYPVKMIAFGTNKYPGNAVYQYGENFCDWVGAQNGVNYYKVAKPNYGGSEGDLVQAFENISNEIIHVVDAGSVVMDEMGKTDEYNFDFVENRQPTLTVDGKVLDGKTLKGETAWGYGEDASLKDGYQFILRYYKDGTVYGGQSYGECFKWEINIPITINMSVQLKYHVKLTNPQTRAGTYGVYDETGANSEIGLYTNKRATLYPVDSYGEEQDPEDFPKPTVSYTVPGNGGGGSTDPTDPTPPTDPTMPTTPSSDGGSTHHHSGGGGGGSSSGGSGSTGTVVSGGPGVTEAAAESTLVPVAEEETPTDGLPKTGNGSFAPELMLASGVMLAAYTLLSGRKKRDEER